MLPVVVQVDGRPVRVGQALVTDSEVTLWLEALSVQLETPVRPQPALVRDRPVAPVAHRERRLTELEWLAQRSRRSLEDPKKARWHDDLRRQLQDIEQEMDELRNRPSDAPKASPPAA